MDQPADSATPPASPAPLAVRALAAPLRQQVVDRLRAAVIAGDLAPGQRLTERELIDRVGVSRTVIREALRQLESEVASDGRGGSVTGASNVLHLPAS